MLVHLKCTNCAPCIAVAGMNHQVRSARADGTIRKTQLSVTFEVESAHVNPHRDGARQASGNHFSMWIASA